MKQSFEPFVGEQEYYQDRLQLSIDPKKFGEIGEALGPEGIGSIVLRNVLNPAQLTTMRYEIADPARVIWHDNHDQRLTERDITVVQNYDAFALKLLQGDQKMVQQVPKMRALAANIENLVKSLVPEFTSLADWVADDMSLHRYDDLAVGLSFHRDNKRFFGMIAVLSLEGVSDFLIKDAAEQIHEFELTPGDLTLTRGTGLYPTEDGRNLSPDHAVVNLKTPHRTSFIVRANDRPNDPIPGLIFDNWKPDAA